MMSQWNPVVCSLNKANAQIKSLKGMIVDDMAELEGKMLEVDARVGTAPVHGGFEDCGTVWDALSLLKSSIGDLSEKCTVVSKEELLQLSAQADQVTNTLQQELVMKVKWCLDEVKEAFEGVGEALKILGAEQGKLTEMVLLQTHRPSVPAVDVGQLSARIKLIEARLPSSQGRLGGEAFQSRIDVMTFVENNVPSNCFYLFHDVVTLMESLTTSHVERKSVLQEWYQSTKVGVNEASARHMASFRLILPSVFGRTKEGSVVSTKQHLPSVKTFKEWNTFDGVSGVKGYIAAGMEDLKYQFCQDIDQALSLEQHMKARLLATEMHECSQNFVMEMSS